MWNLLRVLNKQTLGSSTVSPSALRCFSEAAALWCPVSTLPWISGHQQNRNQRAVPYPRPAIHRGFSRDCWGNGRWGLILCSALTSSTELSVLTLYLLGFHINFHLKKGFHHYTYTHTSKNSHSVQSFHFKEGKMKGQWESMSIPRPQHQQSTRAGL